MQILLDSPRVRVHASDIVIEVRTILLPVDFSDNALTVIEWGSHLAEQHNSKLVLFHAYHLPVEFQQLEGAYLPPDFWANVKAEAQQSLNRFETDLRNKSLQVESVVREGYAATAIVEEAAEIGADLIVIGTHGLSGLKHMLLGSIAERVVQKAPCPVLTVKPSRSQ
ncbi:MAG: universal stress protein [Myxococcota bacterium]